MNKKRKSDVVAAVIAVILVCLAMAFLSGCAEEQQIQTQWGTGDLPADWHETFGSQNISRLNFVQSQVIEQLAARIRVLEINQYAPNYRRIDRVERWLARHTAYGRDPNE